MTLTSQPLQDVMRYPVITVDSAATAQEARRLAEKHRVHHLPVMEDGALVGIICSCDLRGVGDAAAVRSAMKTPVISLSVGDSTLSAARRIRNESIGAIVVLDEARAPCGIVTRGDLMRPDSGVAEILEHCRCTCCGLTRHLRTDEHGQTLCIYCHERATDGSWLELGEGD